MREHVDENCVGPKAIDGTTNRAYRKRIRDLKQNLRGSALGSGSNVFGLAITGRSDAARKHSYFVTGSLEAFSQPPHVRLGPTPAPVPIRHNEDAHCLDMQRYARVGSR